MRALKVGDRVETRQFMLSNSEDPVSLPRGTKGIVQRIDSDGDAVIDFEGKEELQWIYSEHFDMLWQAAPQHCW